MKAIEKLLSSVEAAVTRRQFIGWMVASVPVAHGVHVALLQAAAQPRLNDANLFALAAAILPTEAGSAGARSATDDMQLWSSGYRAAAERNHGYGTARIQNTAADPVPRWSQQLAALDAESRSAYGASFATASVEQRRSLVRAQLERDRATAFPGEIASAQHITLALLASYYASPAATDLCYEAQIGRNTCRPLAQSSQRPAPLQRARGDA